MIWILVRFTVTVTMCVGIYLCVRCIRGVRLIIAEQKTRITTEQKKNTCSFILNNLFRFLIFKPK